MFPQPETRLYKAENDQIQTLIFKRSTGTRLLLENERGALVALPLNQYQNLCLSKRMLLTELHETLSKKLEVINSELQSLDSRFHLPTAANQEIVTGKPKKVHQYNAKTGVFVRTFPSARNAASTYGGDNSNVAKCCKGIQTIAYGFRWSYDKMERLPVKKI